MNTSKDSQPAVDHKGRWKKGSSGNPAGRPLGSRNKAALLLESMIEGEAAALADKLLELARQGNIAAMRMCLDRLAPPRTERTVCVPLRAPRTAEESVQAHDDIFELVAAGELTPSEGETMSRILAARQHAVDIENHEVRIAQLEQAQEAQQDGKAPKKLPEPFQPMISCLSSRRSE